MALDKADINLVMDTIMFPVSYYSGTQMIFDSNEEIVLDVRGWGRIQYLPEPEKRQDSIGEFIADAMNEKWRKYEKSTI